VSTDYGVAFGEHLNQAVYDLMRRRVAWVDAQLAALNPGETLCVHEESPVTDFALDRDVSTFTIREKVHVLAAGVTCDMPERRQQYGPTPADWREVVERIAR